MIRLFFAYFGYIKVPKEAIQLSMIIENYFENYSSPIHNYLLKGQKTLTNFLRSGRF